MRLPIDPTREAVFKVNLQRDGKPVEKTYQLRFALREIHRAELILGMKALKDGPGGVNKIIQTLTDGSLDKLLALFGIMAYRHRPDGIDLEELYEIAEADLDGMMAVCYHVLNITLPKPSESDPNEQPAAEPPATKTRPAKAEKTAA